MRIVIDLQGAQTESRFRGIGRYSTSLAKAIVSNRGEHEVIIALNGGFPETIEPIRAAFHGLLPQGNIHVWKALGPASEFDSGNTWRREVAELIREAFLASLQPDVVYITSLFEGYVDDAGTSVGLFDKKTPIIVSLYDLIPLLNPEQYLARNHIYNEYYLKKIKHLKQSYQLLAISEYAKQEGIDNLGQNAPPIVNISTAADKIFQPITISQSQAQNLRDKYGVRGQFLLCTGGADERKNIVRLIRAYARQSKEMRGSHQLVLAGKMPEGNIQHFQQEAKSVGLQVDELIFTGYITDKELVEFYSLCKLYVFPSWHEGFGLPALEAMSCGAPVIGANTSSLPEVIGNKKALFDPFSDESIANKIGQVLTDENLRKSLIEQGIRQAKKFSWDKSAKTTVSVFESISENKPNVNRRPPATHILSKCIAKVIPLDVSTQDLMKIADAIAQNHPQVGLKQLFVDVSELSQRHSATGVQRVTRSILIELLNNPPVGYQVEPVYASPQSEGYRYAKKYTSTLLGASESMVDDEQLVPMAGDVFLGLDLQHHVVIAQDNYLVQLQSKGVLLYFIVHDLLPITLAKYFADGAADMHTQWLAVISKFDGLVCVSKAVALEVEKWVDDNYPKRKEALRIDYSHNGANIEGSLPSKGLPKGYEHILSSIESTHSFLMVGTLEPRKGQDETLSAFDELWKKGVNTKLVMVGVQGWMVDGLVNKIKNHPQLNKNLFWLDGISDEYLEKVYAVSTCLIAASEGEGFGLPLIEAAKYKLPIIARDIPVFREVAGEHAFYFKQVRDGELAAAVENWIILFNQQKHPVSTKMPWVTWEQSTDCLIDIVLTKKQRRPTKQLFVDISELVQHDAGTGIQRVVKNILKELLTYSDENLQVKPVYAILGQGYRYAHQFMSGFVKDYQGLSVDDLIEYRAGDVFLGLDLQPQIVTAQKEFYRKLRRDGVQVQFVVYDLLCILMPQNFVNGAAEAYTRWLEVVSESDGAICISKAVADEVANWMKAGSVERLRPFNISWFHLGADIKNSMPIRGLPIATNKILRVIKERSSFLMVGTIEPRKGHAQTIGAFEQLWADEVDINLVIVGKQGWLVEELIEGLSQHSELGKRLFLLEGISDEYLEELYTASTCLIAASEGEGFGLPLIEAALHKLPIIARDMPVFREVAGHHAFYFDGKQFEELSNAVKNWLLLYTNKEQPNSDGLPHITWKESAKILKGLLIK